MSHLVALENAIGKDVYSYVVREFTLPSAAECKRKYNEVVKKLREIILFDWRHENCRTRPEFGWVVQCWRCLLHIGECKSYCKSKLRAKRYREEVLMTFGREYYFATHGRDPLPYLYNTMDAPTRRAVFEEYRVNKCALIEKEVIKYHKRAFRLYRIPGLPLKI